AYLRAYNQGITTKPTIQKANVDGHLIRSHMAKMMVEFASLFDKKANAGDECLFSDMDNQSDEMKYYATLACQLRIMGLDVNENPADKFNPDGIVTRAEFGTAFSRLIFEGKVKNGKGKERYVPHLQALKDVNIMKKIDEPFMEELRGRVMLMMMRSAK
ncbi:MAG TPA: S-layer homology domain-containing protein, partial [Candidatus Absconditabacterales bacterium]|nr:S-layer homology domain-containing protein [Candidatus Absconditabacterales bacterium]